MGMDFLLASGRASAASSKPSWGSYFVPAYQDGTEKEARKQIYEFTVTKISFYSTNSMLLLALFSSVANFPASLFCQLISSPFTSHRYTQAIQNTSQFPEAAEDYYSYIILPEQFLGAFLFSVKEFLCIHGVQKRTTYSLYFNRDCVETWENSLVLSINRTDWLAVKHLSVKLGDNSTPEAAKKFT